MTKKDLPRDVIRRLKKLEILEGWGVEGWSCYDEALEEWDREIQKEKIADDFIDRLLEIICLDCEIEEPAGKRCGYAINDPKDALFKFVMGAVEKFKEK